MIKARKCLIVFIGFYHCLKRGERKLLIKEKDGLKMIIGYWLYFNGKKFCFSSDKKQIENIASELIQKENERQIKNNIFENISISIKTVYR